MSEPITLYSFADFDRSARVRWLLHELEVPFAEKRLNPAQGEHQSDEYLKLQPFARVPALNWNGRCLYESGAICTFLADTHPAKGLAPSIDSPQRAEYLQWVFFSCSSLEDAVVPVLRAKIFKTGGDTSEAETKLATVLGQVDKQLDGKQYALGEKFSAADTLLGHTLSLASRVASLEKYPAVQAYLDRLAERPAAKKAGLFDAPLPQ